MAAEGGVGTRLGDLISVEHGWPFKSTSYSTDLSGGPIIVAIGNFQYDGGFRFDSTTTKEYRGDYPPQYELKPGDILLVMTCQTSGGEILGIPARVPDDGRTYLHNQRIGKVVVHDHERVDRNYLYWLFLSAAFNRHLFVTATGSKILHTAPSRIEDFEFDLPCIDEQRRIAHILGTLDDKIELNRRMNQTLEEMARALFKSWFVDFDPVRAKAEGRDPGLPKHLADLFPDRLVDSELGEIPEGWAVAPFSETVIVASGGTPRTSEPDFWLGDIPWFSVVDAPSPSDIWVTGTQKSVSQSGIDSCAASIMPKGTTILSARGTVGKVALAGRAMAFNQSCYGFPVRPGEFGYFTYFSTLNIVGSLQQRAHGSVFSTITRSTLEGLQVPSPGLVLIAAFENTVAPVLDRMLVSSFEAEVLEQQREVLLRELLVPHGKHTSADEFGA